MAVGVVLFTAGTVAVFEAVTWFESSFLSLTEGEVVLVTSTPLGVGLGLAFGAADSLFFSGVLSLFTGTLFVVPT